MSLNASTFPDVSMGTYNQGVPMKLSARSRALMLAVAVAAVPLSAMAADTGGGAVTPAAPAPAPLTLGSTPTTTPASASAATPASVAGSAATKSVDAWLTEARASIASKKWTDAIAALKLAAALEPSNADVHNLLGYSHRNVGDYPTALQHYAAALAINPNHTGALEYQGVAFIKLGQPAKAKANLARLKKICGTGCEQYRDLASALKLSSRKTARLAKG